MMKARATLVAALWIVVSAVVAVFFAPSPEVATAQFRVQERSVNSRFAAAALRGYRVDLRSEGGMAGSVASASADSNGPSWSFSVPGSHGYRVDVSAAAGYLHVLVGGRAAYIEYVTRAQGRGGVIAGDIGKLGKIAMRFLPSGPPRRSDEPNGCHGHRPTVQSGHFVGRFWFRGEGGYVSAYARRAVGYYEHGFRGLCQGDGGRPLRPNLSARAKSGSRSISVAIFLREDEAATHAEVVEHVGGLHIWREVGLAGPPTTSSVESDGSILISPPPPFSGSVRYSPLSPGASWTGDLSADFPGLGSLALAGPRFRVSARQLPLVDSGHLVCERPSRPTCSAQADPACDGPEAAEEVFAGLAACGASRRLH